VLQYKHMSEGEAQKPFAALGRKLKLLRNNVGESLAEVAGAVEIETHELASFELGAKRPSEEVLLLLISHFEATEEQALKLWEAAGYDLTDVPETPAAKDSHPEKVLFTDVVDIVVNNYGVVMNFGQSAGAGKSAHQVARVGMSREHAKSVLKILQVTLAQTEPKASQVPSAEADNGHLSS